MLWIKVLPLEDIIRREPKLQALMKKMKFIE